MYLYIIFTTTYKVIIIIILVAHSPCVVYYICQIDLLFLSFFPTEKWRQSKTKEKEKCISANRLKSNSIRSVTMCSSTTTHIYIYLYMLLYKCMKARFLFFFFFSICIWRISYTPHIRFVCIYINNMSVCALRRCSMYHSLLSISFHTQNNRHTCQHALMYICIMVLYTSENFDQKPRTKSKRPTDL